METVLYIILITLLVAIVPLTAYAAYLLLPRRYRSEAFDLGGSKIWSFLDRGKRLRITDVRQEKKE
jgi:hypothetical protein